MRTFLDQVRLGFGLVALLLSCSARKTVTGAEVSSSPMHTATAEAAAAISSNAPVPGVSVTVAPNATNSAVQSDGSVSPGASATHAQNGISDAATGAASAGASADAGPPPSASTASAVGTGCDNPDLVWRSANKTQYTSYPDPGSEECIEFNGCTWEGQFAACDDKLPEAWVSEHNIVAAFPDFDDLSLHDLCLRKGQKKIVVTVLDTCADSDCDGCCTQNQGAAEQLIDLESYTDARWGVEDGAIEWADLGPTAGAGCGE